MLIGAGTAVYVAEGAVNLLKSIDSLAQLVQTSLPVSPLSGALFVFFNRCRDKVKLLWWDRHGFWPRARQIRMTILLVWNNNTSVRYVTIAVP